MGTTYSSKNITNACCLHLHANFANAFDLMSCQPSNASDTCSDVENGFSLHARTPPNTFNDNLSKKKLKLKKKHLLELWDPHGIALAYVYYTDDWIPST